MRQVLITVVGPAGPVDLAVPADLPVAAVLGPLVRALDVTQQDPRVPPPWALVPLGGDPLRPDRSLAGGGIGDGAVLTLVSQVLANPRSTAPGDSAPTARSPAASGSLGSSSPAPLAGAPSPARPPLWRRRAVVGVVSAASGMGRSTVVELLARALAEAAGGLVVVVDAHPGTGSLSERLGSSPGVTSVDLLALIGHPDLTGDELLSCLAWIGPGLALVALPPASGGRGPPLAGRDWSRLVQGLATWGLTVVLDCGPGLGDPGARAVLAEGDQVVLVVEPTPSAASRWVAEMLANRGMATVAVPWPAPERSVRRVAGDLVADWTALGISAASAGEAPGSPGEV